MQFGTPFEMPVNRNIITTMAHSTIRAITDAMVELVTNSDDSYKRLADERSGRIEIYVEREKGGKCNRLEVRDYAEGMTRERLEKAITFNEPASGWQQTRSVRGLFGRGLKEAIVALGGGEIVTIHDGILDGAKIWSDPASGPMCSLLEAPIPVSDEMRRQVGIEHGNGTKLIINVSNEDVSCPDYKTLKPQITNHYALRDINTSQLRHVELTVQDWKMRASSRISYVPPTGQLVCEKNFALPGYGDQIRVKIWESKEELDSPRNNPFARSGLLVRTEGAILDLRLFRYEFDRAASYFFGEVFSDGLYSRLRKDQTLINQNRGGLEWQRHPYCQALQTEVEKLLAPLVERKKGELEASPSAEVSAGTKKLLNDLCRLLNRLANRESVEGLPEFDAEGDLKPDDEPIKQLTIKPDVANIELDIPRSFSVYAPQALSLQSANPSNIQVESDNPNIQVVDPVLPLAPHPTHSALFYGKFRLVGRPYGEEAWITARLGTHEAQAVVRVHPLGKRRPRNGPTKRKDGFITEIKPDEEDNPTQRVNYDPNTGEVHIYIKFPVVQRYLGPGLRGADTPQGGTMLAELIGEAFCRELARRGLGVKYPRLGSEVDSFNSAVNDLQRKYLHQIHTVMRQRLGTL